MTDDWMAEVKGRVPHRPKRRWWAVAARPMPTLPLDLPITAPGVVSVAGFGLRKMRSNYNGPAINVLRSSDSAVMDIGFRGIDLDVQTLNAFIGGSVGHVNTWYDQGLSGFNLVSGGSTVPIVNPTAANGLPSIAFLTTDWLHHATTPTASQPFTFNAIAARTGAFTTYGGIIGDDGGQWSGLYFDQVANSIAVFAGGGVLSAGLTVADNVFHSMFAAINAAATTATADGVTSGPLATGTNTYAGLKIGAVGPYPLTASVSEGIFWNGILGASDIASLTANQRAYWHTP